jgi:hypothetical protein
MKQEELYDLKLEIGKLLKKVIKKTGKGKITNMIGFKKKKYGEEYTLELLTDKGLWSIYYCDYYNNLELEEGEQILEDEYIPLLLELKKNLETVIEK